MPIRVHCPSCDDHFVTSRRFRGISVRCPLCNEWIKIRSSKKNAAVAGISPALPTKEALAGPEDRLEEAVEEIACEFSASRDGNSSEAEGLQLPIDADAASTGAAGSNGSADVLDYLADEGGPAALRPGAEYVARDSDDSSEIDLTGEQPLVGEPLAAQPSSDEESSKPNRRPLLIAGGGLALLAVLAGSFFLWPPAKRSALPTPLRRVAVASRKTSKAAKPPKPQASDSAEDPGEATTPDPLDQIVIDRAVIAVRHGWFSDSVQIEIDVRNDAEVALENIDLRLEVVAGVFDSSALAVEELRHRFPLGVSPGETESIAWTPGEGSKLGETKLPKNARVRVTVTNAKWLGQP